MNDQEYSGFQTRGRSNDCMTANLSHINEENYDEEYTSSSEKLPVAATRDGHALGNQRFSGASNSLNLDTSWSHQSSKKKVFDTSIKTDNSCRGHNTTDYRYNQKSNNRSGNQFDNYPDVGESGHQGSHSFRDSQPVPKSAVKNEGVINTDQHDEFRQNYKEDRFKKVRELPDNLIRDNDTQMSRRSFYDEAGEPDKRPLEKSSNFKSSKTGKVDHMDGRSGLDDSWSEFNNKDAFYAKKTQNSNPYKASTGSHPRITGPSGIEMDNFSNSVSEIPREEERCVDTSVNLATGGERNLDKKENNVLLSSWAPRSVMLDKAKTSVSETKRTCYNNSDGQGRPNTLNFNKGSFCRENSHDEDPRGKSYWAPNHNQSFSKRNDPYDKDKDFKTSNFTSRNWSSKTPNREPSWGSSAHQTGNTEDFKNDHFNISSKTNKEGMDHRAPIQSEQVEGVFKGNSSTNYQGLSYSSYQKGTNDDIKDDAFSKSPFIEVESSPKNELKGNQLGHSPDRHRVLSGKDTFDVDKFNQTSPVSVSHNLSLNQSSRVYGVAERDDFMDDKDILLKISRENPLKFRSREDGDKQNISTRCDSQSSTSSIHHIFQPDRSVKPSNPKWSRKPICFSEEPSSVKVKNEMSSKKLKNVDVLSDCIQNISVFEKNRSNKTSGHGTPTSNRKISCENSKFDGNDAQPSSMIVRNFEYDDSTKFDKYVIDERISSSRSHIQSDKQRPEPDVDLSEPRDLVFTHPSNLKSFKVECLKSARIHAKLAVAFSKLKIGDPSETLKYSWFSLSASSSTCVVSSKKSGLTFCGVAATLNRYMDEINGSSKCPVIAIVCSCWENVESAFSMIATLIGSGSIHKVSKCYSGITNDRENIRRMLQGSKVLVGTVPAIIECNKKKYISLNEIKSVVIDDAKDVLECNSKRLTEMLHSVPDLDSIAVLSHSWKDEFKNILTEGYHIIITDPVEIASYKKIRFVTKLILSEDKLSIVADFTKNHTKSIIHVDSALEADKIAQMLSDSGLLAIRTSEFLSPNDLSQIKKVWNDSPRCLLVSSDNVLSKLHISDAELVVNFTFPPTRDSLRRRINCMMANILKNKKTVCLSMICEDSMKKLHILIDFFRTATGDVDFVNSEILSRALLLRDAQYNDLCENVKMFGKCHSYLSCQACHTVLVDVPFWPSSGKLRLKVVSVLSATRFYCRVISHTIDGRSEKYNERFAAVSASFQIAMLDSEILDCPINKEFIESKRLVAYKDNSGMYHRVHIKSIEKYKNTVPGPDLLKVNCIDLGVDVECTTDQLYNLPDEFLQFRPLVAEVVFAGLKPKHKEKSWSIGITKNVTQNILDKVVDVTVLHAVSNTVWINQLVLSEKVANLAENMVTFNLKNFLVENQLASLNPAHESMFMTREPNVSVQPHSNRSEFLPVDLDTPYDIMNVNFSQNGTFHVVLKDQNEDLEFIDQFISQNLSNDQASFNFDEKTKCLVNYGGKLCRGFVNHSSKELTSVYLLDWGQTVQVDRLSLIDMDDEISNCRPFQAIECRLFGHDESEIISPDNLEEINSYLLCDSLQITATSFQSSKLIEGAPSYTVKLAKKNHESSKPFCFSSFFFFECLIKPNSQLIDEIYPLCGSSTNPWNGILHRFFLEDDISCYDELCRYYLSPDISIRPSIRSDMDFVEKWMKYRLNQDGSMSLSYPHLDISPIRENVGKSSPSKIDLCIRTPECVKWCQSTTTVYVFIPTTHADSPSVEISAQQLKVKFKQPDGMFAFDLQLFDEVDEVRSEFVITPEKIKVILEKKNRVIDWDNLCVDSISTPWLKYDWDYNPGVSNNSIWDDIRNSMEKTEEEPSEIKQIVVEPHEAEGWCPDQDQETQSLPSEAYTDIDDSNGSS
ncbi:putative ATP-dependent RNA helicase TDRD12 [Thelohanellus kitauei]|uniref:RNA helicase n=1 Tax=Thelohanellus kitauei TaxID=669202 RepID=A0A0C2MC95_THEKT|nr:putative ATP-dependent RNA helicase TDRD12 [Thelohanellus kitauei]